MTKPFQTHVNDIGDVVCEHGTAMDVHCCNCHSGFQFDIGNCHCTTAEGAGALPTDAIWRLLNEADDQKSKWDVAQWGQWFVRLVDAVSQLENDATRRAESGE